MFNDEQHPIYVPRECAAIFQAIADEVVRRKGNRGLQPNPKWGLSFYETNILVGARAVCEALHAPDNPCGG